ncbi:DUF2652 domain-containing protein [Sinomicrobium weinanense]|uniref:DUF2652 domain-containing protein n=1 Tax=Sinomicrobium weinanense TaxID=2842200 RepID=A0A926JVT8_9FLAO|nr:DUF2652 domain-containing protein [Sinomicrobium weinanense]MBC9798508.1 DUF2652 domain-containing protein [Sinomicrobium weinanense]MBU3122487.1 DUF2652 domain-containing protein [Sinomicrobium weinanense]
MKKVPVLNPARRFPDTSAEKKGIIIIPDISGFTSFVRDIDAVTGKYIIQDLLSSIINSNILNLKVSEIEGDAVLFYGYTMPPDMQWIMRQYEIMLRSFNQRLSRLEKYVGRKIDLSLKLIAHYGSFAEYSIGKFRKLYGNVVVEAHQLLKNPIKSNTYILMSDSLVKALSPALDYRPLHEMNGSLKDIGYTYYNYAPVRIQ